MHAETIESIPLAPALGAEIVGFDLSAPLADSACQALRDMWHRHVVLVVRGLRDLAVDDQVRFCRIFGAIGVRARPGGKRRDTDALPPGMMYVSNLKADGRYIGTLPDGEMHFHTDQCYTERPAIGGCLYAIEIPRAGGDTMFGNLCLAWDTLPAHLKRAVEGRRALQVYDHALYGTQTRTTNLGAADLLSFVYPIVREHPVTGRKLLYVNRLMTARIEDMDAAESEAILAQLFDHQEKPELLYTHRWRVGDLLLWDNRCTIHARTDFDPNERRHLRRFTLQAGEA
jgi:taurine dioxygenase